MLIPKDYLNEYSFFVMFTITFGLLEYFLFALFFLLYLWRSLGKPHPFTLTKVFDFNMSILFGNPLKMGVKICSQFMNMLNFCICPVLTLCIWGLFVCCFLLGLPVNVLFFFCGGGGDLAIS